MKAEIAQVSIIIPVYHVEKYLEQCIKSVLSQTFTDFELILVDDGSDDGSGSICDEYARKDARIIVIHQRNGGLVAARRAGLGIAKGDYVLFVDADDWVDDNHVESLVGKAEKEEADVVFCGFCYEFQRETARFPNVPVSFTGKDIIIESLNGTIHAGVCFKLIRRELFVDHQIDFPKYDYFEDMYLSTEILLIAGRIVSTGLTTYHYRYNGNSMIHIRHTDYRIRKYHEFIQNMQTLFDRHSLWNDDEMRVALFHRINHEKLELLALPFSARSEICHAYDVYPDSWKAYETGYHLLRLPSYLALRYKLLIFAQICLHIKAMFSKWR